MILTIALPFFGALIYNGLMDPYSNFGLFFKFFQSSKSNNLASNSMLDLMPDVPDGNGRLSFEAETSL